MANRLCCFICNQRFLLQNLSRIDREDDELIREIAKIRRDKREFPAIDVTNQTRLCLNCRRTIITEIDTIQADPTCARFNILIQKSSHLCFICNIPHNLRKLSLEARIKIFVAVDIYVPCYTKSCPEHLTDNNHILEVFLPGLQFMNRPYLIPGHDLQAFLQGLRTHIHNQRDFTNENEFNDEEFKSLTSLTKEQFRDLLTYCDPIFVDSVFRYSYKKDVITFLCKMRQGLSDEFLKIIFQYSTRQAVSMAIATVRKSLNQRFVPLNVGFQAITRQEYIARHVTAFANQLYNPEPQIQRVVAIVDGTYSFIDKSTNYRTLRQSFCRHKGRHLVKPALIVAPDGFILAVQGPYFSDSQNNDAQMLINEFENDNDGIRAWFQEGDILLVDRGYRDAGAYLNALGIDYKMPHFLQQGQAQLSTEEANESRLITKSRWVIESRNGHIKSIFKFFDGVIETAHVTTLRSFFNIAAALLNKYHPPIYMLDATGDMARRMLERSQELNVLKVRVEVDNLCRRAARWVHLLGHEIQFPHLTLEYLRDLTFGTYQVRLAPSYVQNKLQHEEDEEFHIDEQMNEPGLIRVRVYSRHKNISKYNIFVSFNAGVQNQVDEDPDFPTIQGYYCTCKSGARTLGTCAHVASVLWYLGHARYQQNVKYPSGVLLNSVLDAGHRHPQVNPNNLQLIEG